MSKKSVHQERVLAINLSICCHPEGKAQALACATLRASLINKRVKKEIEIRARKFLIRARKLLIVAPICNFILRI